MFCNLEVVGVSMAAVCVGSVKRSCSFEILLYFDDFYVGMFGFWSYLPWPVGFKICSLHLRVVQMLTVFFMFCYVFLYVTITNWYLLEVMK